jgi:hypothetical protein
MRNVGVLALLLLSTSAGATAPLVIYDGKLESGFADGSWAATSDYSLANASPVYATSSDSIRFVARGWGGLQFVDNATEFNLVDYQNVTFYINGGASGGQQLELYVCDDYSQISAQYPLGGLISGGAIPANAWTAVTLDFDSIGLTSGTFNCFVIMDANGSADSNGQPAAYIDQIQFTARTSPPPSGATVNVSVAASTNVRAVNPLIFGVAYGDAKRNAQMGYTVDRWGGNSTTRYNWQVDVHNTANDYFYENNPDCTAASCTGTPPVGNSADAFIANARAAGIQPLITMPTIGWTPRADSPHTHPYFAGFSTARYGAQTSTDPYDPTAGNGKCAASTNTTAFCVDSVIVGNSASDTSTAVDPSFDQQWIEHLQATFGTAASGGVQLYTLDNEVMLWNSTHRDVHPDPATYDEIWSKGQAYATAIKQTDPDALVTGPVTWGYCDLFSSAADSAAGNCIDGTDRGNHGDLPFVAWYLQQVCANPVGGKNLVDYLDLHYYPQGNGVALSNDDSPATAALRLASLKELYNPSWQSQSWIGQDLTNTTPYFYSNPDLIPRVKAWISQYCPGTKLAITEYNWGNDGTVSGAVAQAEALAIFAREGVDLATRWIAPAAGTIAEDGFSIFLNYDGLGSKVQGNSVSATSSDVDQIGAYAFHGNARTMVLLTNKDTVAHPVALTFDATHNTGWKLFGFSGSSALGQTGSGSIDGTTLTLPALPPISASLLVIPDIDDIFKNGFEVP